MGATLVGTEVVINFSQLSINVNQINYKIYSNIYMLIAYMEIYVETFLKMRQAPCDL